MPQTIILGSLSAVDVNEMPLKNIFNILKKFNTEYIFWYFELVNCQWQW